MNKCMSMLFVALIVCVITFDYAHAKDKKYYEDFILNTDFQALMPKEYKKIKLFKFSKDGEPVMVGECPSKSFDPQSPCAFIENGGILAFDDVNGTVIVGAGYNYGGSAVLSVIYYVKISDGKATASAPYNLGDRVKIKKITIVNDKIIVNLITHGPNDGLCCPTKNTTMQLKYTGGTLVKSK